MIIIVDTREQNPFTFVGHYTVSDSLPIGDYSVMDHQHEIAVERKSLVDFHLSIGSARKRFMREMEWMSCYRCKMLVVESTYHHVTNPEQSNPYTKMVSQQVIGNTVKLIADFGIPVLFCGSRDAAQRATARFLLKSVDVVSNTKNTEFPVGLPANLWVKCSMCGKTRKDAMVERPDLGLRRWLRPAIRVDDDGLKVLGDRMAVCYACRSMINKRTAKLPDGYEWE